MELSVIILNYNGKQYLKDCLSSIFGNTHDITYEVILVDNASTDGSVEYVKKEFPRVRLIINKENVGFTKGNNIGVQKAQGKYICILNNDTIILPDALNNLVHFMKNCSTATPQHCITAKPHIIATGKVLDFSGTPQVNCGRFQTLLSEYLRFAFFLIRYIPSPYSERFKIKTWRKEEVQEVDWASGCYFAMEREDFLKLGGFDENFFIFYEDSDLCLRHQKLAGKVFYYPHSVIKHLGSGFWQTKKLEAMCIDYQSANYFFKKHYSLLLSKMFNYLTKGTWIFNIIILTIIYPVVFGKIVKIKKKIKLLVNLLQIGVKL